MIIFVIDVVHVMFELQYVNKKFVYFYSIWVYIW
jgi:hypothetical protein